MKNISILIAVLAALVNTNIYAKCVTVYLNTAYYWGVDALTYHCTNNIEDKRETKLRYEAYENYTLSVGEKRQLNLTPNGDYASSGTSKKIDEVQDKMVINCGGYTGTGSITPPYCDVTK